MARILVVDDHPDNRALITTLMRYAGHEPQEAADGQLALDMVRAAPPDLVICDLLMPTMDGYEFARRLRAEPALAHTRVIFYTATFMEREARSLAQACGVSQVLVKPCEPEEILRVVAQTLAEPAPDCLATAPDADSFDREHLRVLTDKLADKVDELEAANQRLSALTELNLQMASEHDPDLLLEKVGRGARALLGARWALLFTQDRHGSAQRHVSSWGLSPEEAGPLLHHLQHEALPAALAGQARRFDAAQPVLPGLPLPPLQHGLIAPIASLHHAYGWMLLADRLAGAGPSQPFTKEDEHLLAIHAAQVGRIYENGNLYRQVQETAQRLQIEIAERRQAADALRQANETLEQRVQQRTAELRDIVAGLESFNRSISHDLRGPLGGIAGAARLASNFVSEHNPAKAQRFLQLIAEQADSTRRMVESLLALARASNAQLVRQRVDMNLLLQEVLQTLQDPNAAALPVTLAALPEAHVDPDLARQVFANLIGNALKFSAQAAAPQVQVGAQPTLAGAPTFFVRDNGVGFAPERASTLFKPFERLHGARFEGWGIGLSIVKRIVDHHQGAVWAESAPGQGATFHVRFGPAAEAAQG